MVEAVQKIPTGITGLDFVSDGGLPAGRTTLVAGTTGSAKTIFGVQFLVEGIRKYGQKGVFVTFEEAPDDIRANMQALGWDVPAMEVAGDLVFVDASPQPETDQSFLGQYDLAALLARIKGAVSKVDAKRVTIDSLGAVFTQFTNATVVRNELLHISAELKALGVTSVMTAERTSEYGDISRYGVEEFVVDNVVILRNYLEEEKRRRTLEILKFRGARHQKGEFPFTIMPDEGIVVIPLSSIELKQPSTYVRVPWGNQILDEMMGGGCFRDSIILISGATGTGKTLMTTEFISGGLENKERCLLFAFEESRDQLFRNAIGWGRDFEKAEKDGLLKVVCIYPESTSLEDLLIDMKHMIEDFGPQRVAIDSLSALERVSSVKGFREFVIGATSFFKEHQITTCITATAQHLSGSSVSSASERHISTITDSIFLLRYVEVLGEMRRGLMVLKMRGSEHDKRIREFVIDGSGMHIGRAFRNISGILSGTPTRTDPDELSRMDRMFKERDAD